MFGKFQNEKYFPRFTTTNRGWCDSAQTFPQWAYPANGPLYYKIILHAELHDATSVSGFHFKKELGAGNCCHVISSFNFFPRINIWPSVLLTCDQILKSDTKKPDIK